MREGPTASGNGSEPFPKVLSVSSAVKSINARCWYSYGISRYVALLYISNQIHIAGE